MHPRPPTDQPITTESAAIEIFGAATITAPGTCTDCAATDAILPVSGITVTVHQDTCTRKPTP